MTTPAPLILSFDTSGQWCACALVRGDDVLAQAHDAMARGQAEHLFTLLDRVLAQGGVGWPDVNAIGVGVGPGNFTGIRLSVSAARGLALSLGVPAIGVSGLEAAAFGANGPVLAAVPAPRDHAYVQRCTADANAPELCAVQDIVTDLPVLSFEPDKLPALGAALPQESLAVSIARVALTRFGTDQPRPAPLYLRAADAAPASDPPPVILP